MDIIQGKIIDKVETGIYWLLVSRMSPHNEFRYMEREMIQNPSKDLMGQEVTCKIKYRDSYNKLVCDIEIITEEDVKRGKYFEAEKELRDYLFQKYGKYIMKEVRVKKHIRQLSNQVGKYLATEMPKIFGDAYIHKIEFKSGVFYLQENMFSLLKDEPKIKNKTTVLKTN